MCTFMHDHLSFGWYRKVPTTNPFKTAYWK